MLKDKLLKSLLLIILLSIIIFPIFTFSYLYPSFTLLLTKDVEENAVSIATHLSLSLNTKHVAFNRSSLSPDSINAIKEAERDFNLIKVKLFSPSGEVIYSTESNEIGTVNKKSYFQEIVVKGIPYTEIVKKETKSLEGQIMHVDVVETYVPMMEDGIFLGAFEIYYDITKKREALDKLISNSAIIILLMASFLLFALIISSIKTFKSIGVQRQLENNLKETSTYLEKLINHANAPIIVWDPDFKITQFNHAFERLTGYAADEVIGRELKLLFPEVNTKESMDKIASTVTGEHWESAEIPLRCKDGGIRIALWNSANIYANDSRTLLATIAQGQDITERKKTEELLQESEEKYRTMIEYSNDLIWTLDKEGKFTFCNRKAEDVSGYKLAEWLGKSFDSLLPPEDLPGIKETFAETLKGKSHQHEIGFYRKDGSLCTLLRTASPIIKSGEVVGTLNFGYDLTESKRSEAFIKSILESVDEGFVVIDREYKIISANRSYSDMVKLPVEDISGKHCYVVSHHSSKPCYEEGEDCAVKYTFETGNPHRVLHTHFDSKGTSFYLEIKTFPMKDEKGKIISVIEIINDITEKTKLEEQLRHAQKMEAIGTLAGGIAHDFNNILNVIVGYGELIKMKTAADDPLRSQIDEILAAGERAAYLTGSLLSFSRKQIMALKPANINDIITGFKNMIGRIIGEDIELRIVTSHENLIIFADRVQIDQILMNLATNARDAMPDGGVFTISTELIKLDEEFINAHTYAKPGMYALVSVTDSGKGMDEKTSEKIFEPFFTTKETGKGTGLGLSIVYGIVKQHGGYINAYSEPGEGTTFKIYLPIIESEVLKVESAGMTETKGGTETILLAEDDELVRKLTRSILEGHGYTVIEAVDGEDALKIFIANKDRIQLVILDVIMPKKNGEETHKAMRKTCPDMKTIFMSGYTGDLLDKKGIIKQGSNFIPKPVSPNQLLRKVREVLDS